MNPLFMVINRHQIVLWLLALITLGVLARAVYLQIFYTDFLQGQGNDRYLRVVEIPTIRSMILDRNQEPLAVSSPVDSVWVHPGILRQQPEHWPALAQHVRLSTDDLERRLTGARETSQFLYLRRHLDPKDAGEIKALNLPGVHLQREYRRYYPTGEVTSHLLGFTDIDDIGQEGVELVFNTQLKGVPGSKRVIKDRQGRTVEQIEIIRVPQPGTPLVLSIDRRIQYLAYQALKNAVTEHRAEGGTVVVVDVLTSEILAITNQPATDPNDRAQIKPELLRNRALTDVFEPGSTLKPFAVIAGLESGKYRPNTVINTSPGRLAVGRHRVTDVHNYGIIDVSRVISKSSNVGTSKIALSLPREALWKILHGAGFGQTILGFRGERTGVLRPPSQWSAIGHANHSFGYGLSVTAVQLAQAYAVIAADGVRRPLSIVRIDQPPAGERVFSAKTAQQMRLMLEEAVSRQGTGFRANVPGYRIGGKTGTVRKIVNGRYTRRHYLAVFAGIAPISKPRLAMVIMIDDPKGGVYYGGQVAAPIFSQVMSGALRLLNVTPDALSDALMAASEPLTPR